MRAAAPGVALDAAQSVAADRGLKALIPFGGEPFLAHVLTEVADAGIRDVCIVTAPGPDPIRAHFATATTSRLRLTFAVQHEPLGSAHALAAAETFAGDADIVVINADNLYPAAALRALHDLERSGLIGFARAGLLSGNIDAERLASYAIIEADVESRLTAITEKPDVSLLQRAGEAALISMTCWRFRPALFDVLRRTPRSPRGEYEIPDAVRIAMREERFTVVPMTLPVLDLSRREDVPVVGALLRDHEVRL